MLPEHVVDYTDPQTGNKCKLDINNGYVYDLAGNQVAKMSLKDDSKTEEHVKAINRWCQNDLYGRNGVIDTAMSIGREARSGLAAGNAEKALMSGQGGKLFAMDLGIGDVHQPAPLPNYSAGYRQEAPMADMYAPPLLVDQISGKYYTWSPDDAFQEVVTLTGSANGNPAEVPPRVTNSTYSTVEYALGSFVPKKIEAAADAALKPKLAAAKRVMNALLLAREARVSTLATTSGSWNANNVVTLGAGLQWNGGASSDPMKDLHSRMEASLLRPTGIIMNPRVWHSFVRNPAVQKYFTYKSGAAPIPDPTAMAQMLDLPPIYVAWMRRKISATAYDFVWPDAAVLVRQPTSMPPTDQEDIASALTFRWNALGAAGVADAQSSAGGFIVREFFNQMRGSLGGSQLVMVMNDQEAQTSTFAGGLLLSVFQ